jgi:membrane-associated phospholipid phosphatase
VFPIFNLDGSLAYPELAYPRKAQIIPIWASALMSIFIPTLFFALFQIRRKSMDDFLTSFMGILKSAWPPPSLPGRANLSLSGVVTAAFFQVVIKTLIGSLRPHFYSVCDPDLDIARQALSDSSSTNIIPMFDRSICRGDNEHINDALESMPSGHAAAAWAGLFFLSLYFNAQLKVISAHNPAYWKMVLFFTPLLGACLLSGYLVTDGHHHFADILVGGLIGVFTALVAFRQTFASITDFRFNHILLPRATSPLHRKEPYLPVTGRGPWFSYQADHTFLPRDLPVAREGGWTYGSAEQVGGAPGDATALSVNYRGVGLGGPGIVGRTK